MPSKTWDPAKDHPDERFTFDVGDKVTLLPSMEQGTIVEASLYSVVVEGPGGTRGVVIECLVHTDARKGCLLCRRCKELTHPPVPLGSSAGQILQQRYDEAKRRPGGIPPKRSRR